MSLGPLIIIGVKNLISEVPAVKRFCKRYFDLVATVGRAPDFICEENTINKLKGYTGMVLSKTLIQKAIDLS